MPRAPLRIAALSAGPSAPGWAGPLLDDVEACPVARLIGLVIGEPPAPARGGGSHVLYDLYRRADARRFGAPADRPQRIAVAARLAGLPSERLTAGADAIQRIAAWELDVIVSLGAAVPSAILGCARHGVWSYRHGDRDDLSLFWTFYDGAAVVGSVLERTGRGGSEAIYSSFSAVDPISLRRTGRRVQAKSATFVGRKLRDLHRDGALHGESHRADAARPVPTNRQMLHFGSKLGARLVRRKARQAVARQQWFVAYQRRRDALPSAAAFHCATVLAPPRDRFYADPCLIDWHDETHLFFEQFGYATGKGVIATCQLTADGRCSAPQIALERPYHLSYPFVFRVGEEAFMLPETAASGAIELYRANAFPTGWTLDSVIVSGVRAVDPTLVEHEGRFWLFANVAVDGASNDDELCLFSAPALRGPWEPHPRNPVISDVRRARPAGRPFVDDAGRLIRPSQDCAGGYGSAVVFSRIDELSTTEYHETPVGRLERSWRATNLGTHTYARSRLWEALDGRAWVRRGP
jgi:hypothetical protein